MDATRLIDVLVSGGDYGCCGVPFAVADELGFTLAAVDASAAGFIDVRHQVDDALPLRDVRGRVERIVAVHQRLVPVAGAHYVTGDPGDTVEYDVEAVPVDVLPAGYGGADYRVRLRIPADAPLPPRRAEEARTPAAEAPSGPRRLLTALVERVESRFGDAVAILRAGGDTSVTLSPHRDGAVAVRWNARGGTLAAELERAVWTLPWDADGVSVLADLVDAAARGAFAERVEDGAFVSEAMTADGRVLRTSTPAPAVPSLGPVVLLGSMHARLQRAASGVPYRPWEG